MAGKYSAQKAAAKPANGRTQSGAADSAALNHEHQRILAWLKQVRFKRVLFGGVNEADVWKKIAELNTLYEAALSAERARYDALLAQRTAAGDGKAGDDLYG